MLLGCMEVRTLKMVCHSCRLMRVFDRALPAPQAQCPPGSMQELCADVQCKEHEVCGGAMLRCLTDKAEQITVLECQHVSASQPVDLFHSVFTV